MSYRKILGTKMAGFIAGQYILYINTVIIIYLTQLSQLTKLFYN